MSQPEMRPEGPSEGNPPDGRDGGRGLRPGDLVGRGLPLGDWDDPAERLDELYRWVERGALDMAEWYLADRVWKRRWARVLRAGAAALTVIGVVLPLADPSGTGGAVARWGYLALLLAVACVGCDRFFGLTSGWMRDVATAQAVQRRLQVLQFDWASECVREVLGPAEGTASEAVERCLGVLRRFSDDVLELVRVETADWMVEFRGGPAPLGLQMGCVGAGGGGRPDGTVPARFALTHPSATARPNMPRQRPPEPR
ncbi:SLATT domain-containing protein [Streptomyces sp. JNUCC 64]